ncbi:lipopolysaccharide glycosyltransferase, putative [Virgisporangium aliadipatigenens]|uniref:Lipopolysaccharide glycosyltransferase, putative n=1 Tax=Virgisporangium aliadipatigenens TaxID=741659 RepID=A0A8J3YM11_9ACTN|nr:GT4 family glycosyltransferase PelF [Virgisporangium aliadipatigenens]GIJ47671.1 lipopolysaccharide glycosyltransferase, putative [Virgisporangium aliadipatigenens]
MKVALINEGTYPYAAGGVSTWCDQLVRGLNDVTWALLSITAGDAPPPATPLPSNVDVLLPVPVWGAARPARYAAERAAARMCRGMLGDTPAHLAVFAEGLRELAFVAASGRWWLPGAGRRGLPRPRRLPATNGHRPPTARIGRHPLAGVPLADILLDAWAGSPALPPLTLRDADDAAVLLEQATRPLAALPSDVDLCHANAGGLSALVALGARWRDGIPFALTEHGVYLRERYFSTTGLAPGVKAALLRFHRALTRLAYTEAALIAPVSEFNRRWELRHGADPSRVVVIPNGVDPQRFPLLTGEPEQPTIAWVGRIDPLKDLETLIRAFGYVRAWLPTARLHLAGPVPAGNEAYAETCRRLANDLGVAAAVTFAGPVASSREAFAAGHVAALSSVSEGMPYTVIEAMMCGRATVSTDVGGVADTVGDAGVVVPPRDPVALAHACLRLLTEHDLRADLARRGRERALAQFTLDRCVSAYRAHYRAVAGRRRLPAEVD